MTLRWAGALLLAGCCVLFGIQAARNLGARVRHLEAWLSAVRVCVNEIGFGQTALPGLMSELGQQFSQLRPFFQSLLDTWSPWGDKTLSQLWRARAQTLSLPEQDRLLIGELGGVLGRYDAGRQAESLEYIYKRLESSLVKAREERLKQSRVYAALGVASGLTVMILVI